MLSTSNFNPYRYHRPAEIKTRWVCGNLSDVGEVKFQSRVIAADEIARTFLAFFVNQFKSKDHLIINGASVLPQNDPTLLFINSGMAAIKPYFTGDKSPPYPRLCNVQPCIRTNDIDDIGDMHHLSFFHMLGSWSIGDYYKKDAVYLAHDLLVNILGFPKNKLYVTVFGGDEKLNIPSDDETASYWREVGFPEEQIVFLPAEDNFWGPAGDTGPCGPCTEIFYDMGDAFAPAYVPGRGETFDTKNRYVEIWNGGVFMQYFMYQDKTIAPLPIKSVDTGSGLERMTMTMNGFDSVYETDLIKPIYEKINALAPNFDVTTKRMLTDHIRTAIYLISEGVKPGNVGQEYIVRKLIRKCVTAFMKHEVPGDRFLEIIPQTIDFLADSYEHIGPNKEFIVEVIQNEVYQYIDVIKTGIKYIEQEKLLDDVFPPETAIFLVTAKGLPYEILVQCLEQKKLKLDTIKYKELENLHKKVSKSNRLETVESQLSEQIREILASSNPTDFVGYQADCVNARIDYLIQNNQEVDIIDNDRLFYLVTSATPFYAEGGGQCGDKGIAFSGDDLAIEITDTNQINNIYVHTARIVKGVIKLGSFINLQVDRSHRKAVKRYHSATHLLHYALCEILGEKALQKGSLVEPKKLRFDFKSPAALTKSQIQRLEEIVNDCIISNYPIEQQVTTYSEAINQGAIGLFGEKYGETVRVIKMGPSIELCGGTHASQTGDLGLFLLESEKSISKGIRRIIALTGPEALQKVWARTQILDDAAQILGANSREEIIKKLSSLNPEHAEKSKLPVQALKEIKVLQLKPEINNGVYLRMLQLPRNTDDKALGNLAKQLFAEDPTCGVLVLISETIKGKKINFFNNTKTETIYINAANIVNDLLIKYNGKGGGKPDKAQGVFFIY